MTRRTRRRNGNGNGVSAQRAPMNLRLLTTRYGPSTRPLNLNASARHPRRENWDDWVSVEERRDMGTLVSALKTWFPSLDKAFSDSEWEDDEDLDSQHADVEVPDSKHADVEVPDSRHASLEASQRQSPSKGKGKARASKDEGVHRPSISSLQSVLEEDEGETSGADADVSAQGSSRLNSASTLAMFASSSTSSLVGHTPCLPARRVSFSLSDSHGGRSPGASYITPRSYPTTSLSEQSFRTARPNFISGRTTARPSFSSQRTERTERPITERPSFETRRSPSPSPSTPERQLSFSTEHSIEFTPIVRPVTRLRSFDRSLASSPNSDYAEQPSFLTPRSLNTAASFSTQRSAGSATNASMGLALRLRQISAVPTLTMLPSPSTSALQRSTTPSTSPLPVSRPTTPPRTYTPVTPPRTHTPGTQGTPNTSNRCTPGTSTFLCSSLSTPNEAATATRSALLPSLPSHMVLSSSRSLSSFTTLGPGHSPPCKTLLHDLDAQSLSCSRSILSLPSVSSMAGAGPFLNDLDVVSFGGGMHDGANDSHADTVPTISVDGHGSGWAREAPARGANVVRIADPSDSAAAVSTQHSGDGWTPRTRAEEYAAPVVPRLPTRPLDSSGETVDARGRMARTLRSIQSLSSLRPAASLLSLRARFAPRPSEAVPRPGVKSKGKKRPSLPIHFSRAPPSTPSKYRGGVPGSPAPPLSPRSPRERARTSVFRSNGLSPKPKADPRGKPPKPSARLRLHRPKSHILRHEASTTEAEENERRLREHLEMHGQRREGRLKALKLRGLL